MQNDWRVQLASVKELTQAYLQAVERNQPNEAEFWKAHLKDRLEGLIDSVRNNSGVAGTHGNE